jgi:prepilin-type N-terminal cleavage/methylation domain-containing protein
MPQQTHNMKNSKKGFTLVELMVVIAIVGLLSSIVLSSLGTARGKARDARRFEDLKQMQLALDLYYSFNKAYPLENCGPEPAINVDGWAADAVGYTACLTDLRTKLSSYIKVPLDPINNEANGYTYWYASMKGGQGYMLLAWLEISRSTGEGCYAGNGYYCIGANWQ